MDVPELQTAISPATPSLLGLPREVRDKIISEVLWQIRDALPAAAQLCLDNYSQFDHTSTERWRGCYVSPHVRFQKRVPNPALPLLLTNHQLLHETKDALEREQARGQNPSFDLDLMYLRNGSFWPDWTRVPFLSNHVDTIMCRFRIFHCPDFIESHEDQQSTRNQLFRGGDGGPSYIVWVFYHMLTSVFVYGPLGYRAKPAERDGKDDGLTVRNLILDFLPTTEPGLLPLGPYSRRWRSRNSQEPEVVDYFEPGWHRPKAPRPSQESLVAPDMLSDFVIGEIRGLLSLGYHFFDYGKMLYERVGTIDVRLDGVTKHRMDLSQLLDERPTDAQYSYSNSFAARRPEIEAWKELTRQQRLAAGMSSIGSSGTSSVSSE